MGLLTFLEWLPISEAPYNTRLIFTFNFEDVYAGAFEEGNKHQVFDGAYECPFPTHFTYFPKQPIKEQI